MNDDRITALAREYGEYVANSLDYDMCSNPELRHRLVVKGNSESAQLVLEWLLRRFCLVEKSKVEETYYEATMDCGNIDPCSDLWEVRHAEKCLLESLFLGIAKEVEG